MPVCFATECVWCHESGVKFAHVLECDPSALSSFVVYGKHDNTAINDFSIGCVYFPPHMHPFSRPPTHNTTPHMMVEDAPQLVEAVHLKGQTSEVPGSAHGR